MLGGRHAKSAFRAHLPLTPERSAECCGGDAITGLDHLPRPNQPYSESFRSPQALPDEGFPQGRSHSRRPRAVDAHSEGMQPERSRQDRQTRAHRTTLYCPRISPHRLAVLATALAACGSLAALPGAPPAQGMSAVTVSAPGAALTTVPVPPIQEPVIPELTGTAPDPPRVIPFPTSSTSTSSASFFTSASLPSRLIEETGTSGQEGTDRAADPRRARGHYRWPTGAPATVVEDFDPPAVVWGRGHRGVDLAAAEGTQIRSAAAGTVAFAGMVAGRPVVSVDHADGIRTTYEPVEPTVSAGDPVGAGQVIGTLLPGHRSDGVCALHWGARTGPKTYINPLRLLQPAVIRLKPLH